MSNHTFARSNHHLNQLHSHPIDAQNFPLKDSAPFFISKHSNQTVAKHLVSQSAHWTNL